MLHDAASTLTTEESGPEMIGPCGYMFLNFYCNFFFLEFLLQFHQQSTAQETFSFLYWTFVDKNCASCQMYLMNFIYNVILLCKLSI